VYSINNRDFKFITPLDNKAIDLESHLNHPVFWFFKGEEIINSATLKRSKEYRNLINYASNFNAIVKLFDKSNDIKYFKEGDYAIYLNSRAKEQILSYIKIGKNFKILDFYDFRKENFK